MDAWIDSFMDQWIDGLMDGWMDADSMLCVRPLPGTISTVPVLQPFPPTEVDHRVRYCKNHMITRR